MRRLGGKSAAVPATVGGSPAPEATGRIPGRRRRAAIREPGDLPSRCDSGRPAGYLGKEAPLTTRPVPSCRCRRPRRAGRGRAGGGDGARLPLVPASTATPRAEPRPGSLLVADAARAAAGSGVAVRHVGLPRQLPPRADAPRSSARGCWAYVFGGLGTEQRRRSRRRGAAVRRARPTASCRSAPGPRR